HRPLRDRRDARRARASRARAGRLGQGRAREDAADAEGAVGRDRDEAVNRRAPGAECGRTTMAWPEKNLPTTDASEKKSVGAGVFRRCDSCGHTLTAGELAAAFEVCPQCGHHHRLEADGWRRLLLDDGELE